ncbi:MAG TPA: FG-GAP-like repeat-containing protein, partial [Polyangiaceae bacterium]|nr:FG-GAP-like repeat-containing protein [Polyangiaceae bacterium]
MRCRNLIVRDREGVQLNAHFAEHRTGLRIVVDDSDAQYPIQIDPIYETFSWAGENNQASAYFGFSAADAGDVNGDGFDDVIVGAYQYDTTGANPATTDEGAAYVFLGSVLGLSTTVAWTAESNQATAYFGYAVAGAGDVNNDGFDDVIVGAYQYDEGQSNEGAAFVYHGGESGPTVAPAWTGQMNQIGSFFGFSVAGAGDVNNDGFDDVIVGALNYAINEASEGGAFIYHGSAAGLNASPARSLLGGQASASLGQAVSGAGDTNNDGYDDVIIGADRYNGGQFEEGAVFVFRGSATGIGAASSQVLEIDQTSAHFGYSLSRAGNVNGDAFDDVIIGAYLYDNGQTDEGRAFLFTGSSAGLVQNSWLGESNQASANYGLSVTCAGDVDKDGYDDVLIGAPAYDNGSTDEGRVYLYTGTDTGLDAAVYWTLESNQTSAAMGQGVGGGGDVNGDGYADILVGSYKYDNGSTDEGRVFAYYGSEAGPGALLGIWTAESDQGTVQGTIPFYGLSVAGAGDVNNDGFDDVIVGAYSYDSGNVNEGKVFGYYGSKKGLSTLVSWSAEANQDTASFGQSVAGAGDVNNDGFDDVIIGARLYDSGETDEGAAFIYKGSANGLEANYSRLLQSNQGSPTPGASGFGIAVASAGDVNDDGYDDVIVGANLYDNGTSNEGSAFVYLGSANGTALAPAWSAEPNSATANYGISVASAGDVNGDGYDDVLVGASTLADAFLYLGSSSGPQSSPAWTTASIATALGLGYSVAGAGDVNNDGYDDVLVSANKYAGGQTAEGAVWLFQGSSTGLATNAAWIKEGNVANVQFGESVAGAGDVNDDGFDDVIIGAPFASNGESTEGTASVYLGSAGGLLADPALLLDSNQAASSFGISVAGAGDVNGDGYDDLLVGATRFDNGTADEGRAFAFQGSACIGHVGEDNDDDGAVCPWDCDGADDTVYPGATDAICDGIDNDCSGVSDNDFVAYATSCGMGVCVRAGTAKCVDGVIDPQCTPGTPGPSDSNCNNIDENCNGTSDEQYPGTPTTCGVGACAASGAVTCVSGSIQNTCSPGTPAPSDADCDGVDDDCNGQPDEDFAASSTICGVGACASTGSNSCVSGNVQDSCVPGTPAASDADCDGVDDNCNNQTDEGFSSQTTNCGIGACAATGSSSCVSGQLQDSCNPGTPAESDADCDGVDDDCNGQPDEDFVSQGTTCGEGACAASGSTSCVGGNIQNSCSPGQPAASDADCDGVDDDCNNQNDEDYVSVTTNCGIGACARTGSSSCVGGGVQANCTAGAPLAGNDATCDGVDDDCDNIKDEDYPVTPTTCGAGACASTGEQKCINGSVVDTCVAGTQAPSDPTCDGVDDDCDNFKDEDYQPQPSSCGLGVCVASGTTACVNGAVQTVCTPGSPTGPDTTCNNSDEDCSGEKDEDYVSEATSCGVGACLRAGATSCVNGGVVDSCVAGAPAANDASCNGVDNDCNNQTDEDYVSVTTNCGVGACAATGSTSCVSGVVQNSCIPGLPAANDASCNGIDNDCSGQADEDYVSITTSCGDGACART